MSALQSTLYEWPWNPAPPPPPLLFMMGLVVFFKDVGKVGDGEARRCILWVGHLRHFSASELAKLTTVVTSKKAHSVLAWPHPGPSSLLGHQQPHPRPMWLHPKSKTSKSTALKVNKQRGESYFKRLSFSMDKEGDKDASQANCNVGHVF